jgi:hypothetical protein
LLASGHSSLATLLLLGWIRHWNSRQEHLGVFVLRIAQDLVSVANLNKSTVLHHGDSVSQNFDHGDVVADKETRELELFLNFLK